MPPLTRSETLLPLVGDKAQLQHYAATTPIVDMVRFSPAQLDAEALIGLLRPLTPRLYSIASSQAEAENEVHVTVGVVRYDIEGRARAGGASSFLADRVEEDGEVRIFIEHNDNFRLPANPQNPGYHDWPGNRDCAVPRLYAAARGGRGGREELVVLRQSAFHGRFPLSGGMAELRQRGRAEPNRPGPGPAINNKKIYVQDKLREQGAEVWRWINDGAHIYVCGDANRMAKRRRAGVTGSDCRIRRDGRRSGGRIFLSELRVERRYQRDVY